MFVCRPTTRCQAASVSHSSRWRGRTSAWRPSATSAGSGLGGLLLPDEFALDHDLDLIADDELAIVHHVKRQAAVLPADPSGGAAAPAPGPSGRRQADLGVWSVEDALAALRGGEAVMVDVVDAGPLARSRLVAAVVTGTLGWCRVYHTWRARAVDISSAHS